MTTDRDLAERAAWAMGWKRVRYQRGVPEPSRALWMDCASKCHVGAPSLADAAFCWAMLEWLYRDNPRIELNSTADLGEVTKPSGVWSASTGKMTHGADLPEALARAVIASEEQPDDR